jgi:N-acetylglucosaminyldiphosphoundecaprenol N-acetyl-beta-D-mannosaminyltransferase
MSAHACGWPRKFDLFGVQVSATNYEQAVDCIMDAAREHRSAAVTALAVHGLVTAARDKDYCRKVNTFEIISPDGQPVRWALNKFYASKLNDRVYGPELMLRCCKRATKEGTGVYLYGSKPHVVAALAKNLSSQCPGLRIVGAEPNTHYPLSAPEADELVQRINASGAGLLFLGMGCPRQETFCFEHHEKISAVSVCVGAAFDFHAGLKPMAPPWVQKRGLEWAFRLYCEPGRLWRRYLVTNTMFMLMVAGRILGR